MSMGEKGMQATTTQRHWPTGSPLRVLALRTLAAVLAIGLLWPPHLVLFLAYLKLFVPMLGRLFCGDAAAYAYILESLQHYPAQQGVAARMREFMDPPR